MSTSITVPHNHYGLVGFDMNCNVSDQLLTDYASILVEPKKTNKKKRVCTFEVNDVTISHFRSAVAFL